MPAFSSARTGEATRERSPQAVQRGSTWSWINNPQSNELGQPMKRKIIQSNTCKTGKRLTPKSNTNMGRRLSTPTISIYQLNTYGHNGNARNKFGQERRQIFMWGRQGKHAQRITSAHRINPVLLYQIRVRQIHFNQYLLDKKLTYTGIDHDSLPWRVLSNLLKSVSTKQKGIEWIWH